MYRGLKSINQACDFSASAVKGAACLGEEAAPLDDACFSTYASVIGVPKASAGDIQAPFKAIHTACSAITTQVLHTVSALVSLSWALDVLDRLTLLNLTVVVPPLTVQG